MGVQKHPASVKLFLGIITGFPELIDEIRPLLIQRFGPIDHESPLIPFTFTDYYTATMGQNLQRKFFSFERLIRMDGAASIKIETNGLEGQGAGLKRFPVPRPINLDPGYMTMSKVHLLTTKNFSHRVYLNDGIYAEVTLIYKDNAFAAWPWTFPDYQTPPYHEFFAAVRRIYQKQLAGERE